jgi:hypothetical protein
VSVSYEKYLGSDPLMLFVLSSSQRVQQKLINSLCNNSAVRILVLLDGPREK